MKKIIICIGLIVAVALISFSVYGLNIASNPNPSNVLEPTNEGHIYQETTQDTAIQAASWQDAYADILIYYAQLPISTTSEALEEWRFMLHDIDQNGIPELFLVIYNNGIVDHRAVYGFKDGSAIRLKTSISGEINGGMILPPNGAPGIIRFDIVGHIYRYIKYELSGVILTSVANGDFVALADSFRLNAFPVTEDEFDYVFGGRDEKDWLTLHEINEDNIRNIITNK